MKCDKIIDKKLLEQGPMVADCFANHGFTVIVGKPGQGKTSLIVQFIDQIFRKCFHNIYLIMPPESREDLVKDIFKVLPDANVFPDLTAEVLDDLYEKMKADKSFGETNLVLIDDFQNILKQPDIERSLERIIIKMRHTHSSIYLLNQNFQKLSKKMRSLASNVILFDLGKQELVDVFDESFKGYKKDFVGLMQIAFVNPHDWICLNQKSRRIYRMFDLIEFG
jgi:KaiC/GvpD/RAD55 family RecA-like ATPase